MAEMSGGRGAEKDAAARIAAGRIKHGVGASEDFTGNVCHLVSPIVGTLRLRQRDGSDLPDIGWVIDRLSLVLDMAREEAERETPPYPVRCDRGGAMNLPDEKREAFRVALERDYGCKPGQVHEGYGAECASAAHAPALYRTFGCDHVAHLADALAPLLAGWLADAYERGVNDTFATDGALLRARAEGEARARARVEEFCADWERSADEDERYLDRAHASEIHDVYAAIRMNREHATALRAALDADAEESQ